MTFFYDPVDGITVTAKRDQVTPTLEYTRLSIQEQARKMKLLSNAVKSGSVPSNTDPGAVAILGVWVKRDPLTQYSGLSLTSTDPVFGKYLARFLPKVFPLAVPVPGEQRGRGWLAEGPVEWVWNTKIVWEAD
jgi:hypothetical protein